MSALERSSPRFCLNPRSMASRSEIGITPGTGFAGTLPANGLTPPVPGMGSPGALGVGVVPVCAKELAAPHNKTPASRNARQDPSLSLKGASLLRISRDGVEGDYPSLVTYWRATGICPAPGGWLSKLEGQVFFYGFCELLLTAGRPLLLPHVGTDYCLRHRVSS